ncbi:hypothetical protein KQY30_33650 [Streptomyces sp. GMY02]|uniref:hypothetical protein n=1 Tax=Streptomyces sp. GMY02 TaxID=1333528 RepID=UPI001C2BD9AF|nr:hypothetical protein [Streptomyces sp. GMY02]QXE38446.1 hypothetical protein KQY30_33650 [Streptomyces sp. GMY02]
MQLRTLPPAHGAGGAQRESLARQWRHVLANRPFLALPMAVRDTADDERTATIGTGALFAVSGLATILSQTRVSAWCKQRWSSSRAITVGLALMGAAFVPLLWPVPTTGISRTIGAVAPAVLCGLLLAVATMIVYPFERDTIVTFTQSRLVATHYGLYNTICGIGVTAGNLLTGAALDAAARAGIPALPWISLTTLGLIYAGAIHLLSRPGQRSVAGKKEAAEITGQP